MMIDRTHTAEWRTNCFLLPLLPLIKAAIFIVPLHVGTDFTVYCLLFIEWLTQIEMHLVQTKILPLPLLHSNSKLNYVHLTRQKESKNFSRQYWCAN
jgi:hypothetical protein